MEKDIQTYVIHCDKHKERLLNIENHIKNIIPQYAIWKGIIPYYEDIEEETPYMSIEKMIKNYDNNIILDEKYHFKTLGQIGCYLSHITLMRYIKNNVQDSIYTIILEDDANLTGDFNEKIKSILNDFNDFDMLYLGASSETFGQRLHNQLYVYSFDQGCINGTYAYVVKNSSAEKIYNLLLDIKETIDGAYSRLIHTDAIKAFIVRPFLVNYDRTTFYSTIDNNKETSSNSIIKKSNARRKLHVVDKIIKCMNIIVNSWLIRDERSVKNSQKFKHIVSNQKIKNKIAKIDNTNKMNKMNNIKITSKVNHTFKSNPEIKENKSLFMKKMKNKRTTRNNFKYFKKENKDEKIQEIVIKEKNFTIHGVNSIKKDNNFQTIKLTIMKNKKRGKNPYVKK